jgi:regulator of protease activity HflC (stomatin/prohibitin superfamily)
MWWTIWAFGGIILIVVWMRFYPPYSVWQQGLRGEAELARAEQNRQIEIARAKAKKEAAGPLKDADIIRAQGVAEANKIIGESLKNNPEYIKWLWVDSLSQEGQTAPNVIYVPTEAGLPILEAGKR